MRAAGVRGSVVSLMCDRSDRYGTTFGDAAWLAAQQLDTQPYVEVLDTAWTTLTWTGS